MDQEYPRTIVRALMSVRYYIPSLKLEPNLEIVVLEDYDSLEAKYKKKIGAV